MTGGALSSPSGLGGWIGKAPEDRSLEPLGRVRSALKAPGATASAILTGIRPLAGEMTAGSPRASTTGAPVVRAGNRMAYEMAYVITHPCIGVKDASCVEVCPVDCIHTDDASEMYFIDPEECIDCGACVDPCPVDAIFPEDEVPAEWTSFIQINTDYFQK